MAAACSEAGSGGGDANVPPDVASDTHIDPVDTADTSDPGDVAEVAGDTVDVDVPDVPVEASPWAIDRLSTSDALRRVWGPGDGTFWAAGDRGALLHFNGITWIPVSRLTTQNLYGVAGLPTGEVFVAGGKGTVLRRDSAGWNRLSAGVEDDLHAVFAVSATEVYFVGADGRIVFFDGKTFEIEVSNTLSDLFAVIVPPGGAPIAAGTGGRVFKRQGGQWVQIQAAGASVTIQDLFATSAQFIVGVGTEGTIVVSTGGAWSSQVSNDVDAHDLYAVWGTSDVDVFCAGDKGTVIHYDGEKWTTVQTDGPLYTTANLRGLAGTTVGEARLGFAVGQAGAVLRYDGATWVDAKSGPDVAFKAVAALTDGAFVAVGQDGLAARWTEARGWTAVDVGQRRLEGVAADGDQAIAVGEEGAILAIDAAGKTKPFESPTTRKLNGAAVQEGVLLAVGQAGVVVRIQGSATAVEPSGTVAALLGVAFREDGTAIAVGETGTALQRSKAGAWTAIDAPVSVALNAVFSRGGQDIVVGDHGTVLEGTGGTLTRRFELPGLFLYGIYDSGDLTTAVGWAGRSLTRTEEGWSEDTPVTANVLEGVAGRNGVVFAVGHGGTVLRRR